MEAINIIIEFISFLLAFLAASILFFVNKDQSHSNKMLAWVLLLLALTAINSALLYKGWFINFPRLHKIAAPFSLLILPFAYLYIRSVLLGELKFRKYDWLLLLPAILYALNLMPYYLMSNAEKKERLIAIHNDSNLIAYFNEGIFPKYVFPFVRVVWSSLFIVLNFKLINQFKKAASVEVLANNKALVRWLYIFNGLFSLLILSLLTASINVSINKTNYALSDFALGLTVTIICAQLFLRPRLLYGVFHPTPPIPPYNYKIQLPGETQVPMILGESISADNYDNVSENSSTPTSLVITTEDNLRYKKIVETLFEKQLLFLQPDYTLEQLVTDSNIPRYILSAFINREYGMGFREFLNRRRVDYFINNLNNPAWKKLTLEAVAEECGFNNRSTFIKNFKEITGETPAKFVKNRNT